MEYLIIQLKEQQLLAARYSLAGRTPALAGAVAFQLGPEQDLASAIDQVAAEVSGSPAVVLCLPPALFAQRRVELPLTDLRKVREVLPNHLQGEMALQPEEAVFEALPDGPGRFLAVWAKKSDLTHQLENFRQAGLEPRHITCAPLAWNQLPGIPASCLVCDGSALTLISDGQVVFMRAFGPGNPLVHLQATLAALELSAETLPSRLVVFGDRVEELESLAVEGITVERLQLPEELARQFRGEEPFQQLVATQAVAGACQAKSLADFRRGELVWAAGDAILRRKLYLTAALAVTVVILLFTLLGLKYRQASRDLASLNASITALYKEIFPNRPKAVDEVAEVKGELKKLVGGEGAVSFMDSLRRLADAKGATINGLYEVEQEGRTLRMKGDARSSQAVNDFKAALAPSMASLELGEIKGRPDGTVSFSMTATLREGKP